MEETRLQETLESVQHRGAPAQRGVQRDAGTERCAECGSLVHSWDARFVGGSLLCQHCGLARSRREEEEADLECCARCGKATRSWNREPWRDGSSYCGECACELEEIWVAEHSCMACGARDCDCGERFFPPERIQQRDSFVRDGKLPKRFICKDCFDLMTKRRFASFLRETKSQTPLVEKMRFLLGIGGGADGLRDGPA
jgi:hypothetical protein